MNWRAANDEDLDLLAEWNKQLIEAEGPKLDECARASRPHGFVVVGRI